MERRTLVIGGSRNLGPDLLAALTEAGDRITVLNRGLTAGPDLPPGATRLRADRSDPVALSDALAGRTFDLVVDTTLYTGPDAGVLAELLRGRARRLVFWSTGQVYLVRTGPDRPFREEDYDGPLMPCPAGESDRRNWEYGIHKRKAEDVLRGAAVDGAFELAVLRMPMISSRRDHYGRIPAYVHRLMGGGPVLVPAEGGPPLRHVFGGDVIAATLAAADLPLSEPLALNIGQDETQTLDEMLAMIAALCDRPLDLLPVPRADLDARHFLPACSPFSDAWMSSLDNDRATVTLGLRFTAPADYLPGLVAAARRRRPDDVPGLLQRPAELEFAETLRG